MHSIRNFFYESPKEAASKQVGYMLALTMHLQTVRNMVRNFR